MSSKKRVRVMPVDSAVLYNQIPQGGNVTLGSLGETNSFNIATTVDGLYSTSADSTQNTNTIPYTTTVASQLAALPIFTYTDSRKTVGRVGMMASDITKLAAGAVSGTQIIKEDLIFVAFKAIAEQKTQMDTLSSTVNTLVATIAALTKTSDPIAPPKIGTKRTKTSHV